MGIGILVGTGVDFDWVGIGWIGLDWANWVDGQTERHSYEKCQYDLFLKRVKKMDELREAKGGKRSN